MVFVGGNNITLSQSSSAFGGNVSNTISIVGAAGGAAGTQTIGASNLGNTAGTSGVATGTGVQFVFAGSNNITLSQSINGASGTISIVGGAGGGGAAIGMTNTGSTSGTVFTTSSGTVYFQGSGGVTVSNSTAANVQTIWISAPNGDPAIGVTNTGNTAGTNFTTASGTVYFQGTNNITVSNSSAGSLQTLWISGPTGGGAGMGTGTNTSGTSGTVGKELYIYGNSNIGLSQSVNGSSASLTIVVPSLTISSFEPWPVAVGGANTGVTNAFSIGAGTSGNVYLWPMLVDEYVAAGWVNLIASHSFVTIGTSSGTQQGGFIYGLYTRKSGASSTVLSYVTGSAFNWTVTGNNSSYTVNYPTTSNTNGFSTGATNSGGVNLSSLFTGAKLLALPLGATLTPGPYWLAVAQTVATATTTVGIQQSIFGWNHGTTLANLAPFGGLTSAYTAGSTAMGGFGGPWNFAQGSWSTANNATLPASIGLQSVTGGGVSMVPYARFWTTQ
jgi:hypothetical protein